jgi:hypothetical protein
MTFRYVRRTIGPAIFACAVAHSIFGCSGNKPAKARAYVNAVYAAGVNPVSLCGTAVDMPVVSVGSLVTIPMPGQLPVTPTADGDFSPGAGTAHVACSVSGGGSSFQITLSAAVDGMGSFSAYGMVDSMSGGTGIIGNFTAAGNGTFRSSNCTISYSYNNMPVPVNGPPVSSGRIFAHIDCPDAVNMGQSGLGADGGIASKTCEARADFLFENCD